MRERLDFVDSEHVLSTRKQCEILEVHRSGLYYKPEGEKKANLEIMRMMDEHYLKHPTAGVLRMQDLLLSLGMLVNHKRVRRLLRLMGMMAIYPKRNLSKLGLDKIYSSLLVEGVEDRTAKSGLGHRHNLYSHEERFSIFNSHNRPVQPFYRRLGNIQHS